MMAAIFRNWQIPEGLAAYEAPRMPHEGAALIDERIYQSGIMQARLEQARAWLAEQEGKKWVDAQ
jgi:hypothetical protein